MAKYLMVKRDIQAGHIIPFCLKKSVWTVVAMLAIMKTGAACAALDPSQPVSRIKRILDDTEAPLVIVHRDYLGLAETLDVPSIVLGPDLWEGTSSGDTD